MKALTLDKSLSQDLVTLQRVWQTIDNDSCPHHYNFHMHTIHSDGRLTPQALMEQAVKIGLKGMAITDHHSVQGYKIAHDWLNHLAEKISPTKMPQLWTGIEITANLLDTEVHILGYAFEPEHSALRCYLNGDCPCGDDACADQVISALHQAGGLAILAHPARYRRKAEQLIAAAAALDIDGIEAYYAYNNPRPWQPSQLQTEQMLKLSREFNLFTTCGTDTHGTNLLLRI